MHGFKKTGKSSLQTQTMAKTSANVSPLSVSRTRTNFDDRAFSAAGPRVWNDLPMDLRQPDLSYRRLGQSLETIA